MENSPKAEGGLPEMIEKTLGTYLYKGYPERDWQMTCEEAVQKLYEYLDKELDQESVEKLNRHLEICRSCCDHFEFEKKVRSLIQEKCTDEKAPAFLKDRIRGILDKPE